MTFNLIEQLKAGWYGTGIFSNPFDSQYTKDSRNSYSSSWDALDKMLSWDAGLSAFDQIRRLAVLSFDSSIEPDTDSPQDKRAAEFLIEAVKRLENWDVTLWQLLDVHAKGLSVALRQFEREGNRVFYKAIIPLPQYWFYFKLGDSGPELWFRGSIISKDFAVDEKEFAVFSYDTNVENPYGKGYLQRCLYPYLQKQILTAYALQGVQQDIDPLRWAVLAKDLSAQKGAVRTILEDMGRRSAAVFDEGTTITVQPPGGVDALRSKLEFRRTLADEEAKIILGGTLTTDTSKSGGGAYALGEVHQAQKQEIVTSAVKDFDRQINHQLLYPLLDANFFTGRASYKTNYEPAVDLDGLAKRLKDLGDAMPGFAYPVKWAHHEFDIPEPVEGEPIYTKGRPAAPLSEEEPDMPGPPPPKSDEEQPPIVEE